MAHFTRREFLKTGLAAGTLAVSGRPSLVAQRGSATDLVTLGRSGVKVTRLGFGTGTLSGRVQRTLGQEGFTRLVRHAYDRGIRFFETAESYGEMHRMLGIALKYNGHSMNSTNPQEVRQAAETILKAKKSRKSLGFEGGVGGKNRVQAGEATMAIVYDGDAVRATSEDKNLGFAVPKGGSVIWVDVMLVPSKAPNAEGAHQFINYVMDGKAGAKLSNFNRYPTPNKASLPMINEEDRKDPAIYPPQEIVKKLEYLSDLGENTRLYDEAWTNVKAQ
jgi:hypothetical protein